MENKKFGWLFLTQILISISVTWGQRYNVAGDDGIDNLFPSPRGLFAFVPGRLTSSAVVGWLPLDDAVSYILKVYRRSDSNLVQEISDLDETFVNITDLEGGTKYTVSVTAVYNDPLTGLRVLSSESKGAHFETDVECTGGQSYTECNGHCVATCDDPDPVCSRVCSGGCACPESFPIWYGGNCIPSILCPTPRAKPIRPTNVHSVPFGDGRNVIIAWNPVNNTSEYLVKVRSEQRSEIEERSYTSVAPIIAIPNLDPGVQYKVSVAAFLLSANNPGSSNSLAPPTNIITSAVTPNSFRVRWMGHADAVRHSFVLYDETQTNVIYTNDKIATNIVDIIGLTPGTVYYYALASARSQSNLGSFSSLMRVRTQGNPDPEETFHASVVVEIPITETSTTAVTTTTTTQAMTHCRQAYESVRSFYESFPGVEGGPSYPECDPQGMYVTKKCLSESSSVCWCIRPENGNKISGTDFGGENSAIELNCDQVGTFNAEVTGFRAQDIHTSAVLLRWKRLRNISGYVLVLTNVEDDSVRINSVSAQANLYVINNLQRGHTYNIGIFAVSSAGWSTPTTAITVTTLAIDKPSNVRVTEKTHESASISWDNTAYADAYEVRLLSAKSKKVLQTFSPLFENSFSFAELNSSAMYAVEVLALTTPTSYESNISNDFVYIQSLPSSIEFRLKCVLPPLDLIYAYDSSNVVGYHNLPHLKAFYQNVTATVPPLNPTNGTRVAAIEYYSMPKFRFGFSIFSQTSNLINVLQFLININEDSPVSNVTKALSFIKEQFFTSPRRANEKRDNARSVVILFSTGSSNDIEKVRLAADSLKSVTRVVAVGVAGSSDEQILSAIASENESKIMLPDYSALNSAGEAIKDAICKL